MFHMKQGLEYLARRMRLSGQEAIMMLVLEVAGGIILAVIILALLD